MNVELKGKMVEELSKKYLDLLQRLNMRVNDDINGKKIDTEIYFYFVPKYINL